MTLRLGVHMLASRRGYRTLAASADVTPQERALLEPLVFGQSSDPAFLISLETEPAVFVRMLGGEGGEGRVALTRIFAGRPDEAGRATLELRTLLMSRDDYARLVRGSLDRLLADEDLWRRESFESGEPLLLQEPPTQTPPPVGRNELLMMDAWIRTLDRPGSTAVLADSPAAGKVLLSFLRVLSPEDLPRCRWGLRLLSLSVDVHLATAPPSLDRGSHELVRIDLRARPVNAAIAFLWEQRGVMERLPASDALRSGAALASPAAPATGREHAPDDTGAVTASLARGARRGEAPRRAWLRLMMFGGGAALLVIVIVAAVALSWDRWSAPAPLPTSPEAASDPPSKAPELAPTQQRTATENPTSPVGSLHANPTASEPQRESAPSGPASGSSQPSPKPTTPEVTREPADEASPSSAPSAPESAPPDAPASPRKDRARDPKQIIERIQQEKQFAAEAKETLDARSKALSAALDGVKPTQPGDRWSEADCGAVVDAIKQFNAAFRLVPAIFNAERLSELAHPDAKAKVAELWPECEQFANELPLLAGLLESLQHMNSESFRNAVRDRTRAHEALQRSKCPDDQLKQVQRDFEQIHDSLRKVVGEGAELSRAAKRADILRETIRARLAECPCLDRALIVEADRLAPRPSTDR